jgi:hypothetical protein
MSNFYLWLWVSCSWAIILLIVFSILILIKYFIDLFREKNKIELDILNLKKEILKRKINENKRYFSSTNRFNEN